MTGCSEHGNDSSGYLTHCGPVTQICVLHYNCARRMTQICVFNTYLVSTHYTLNYTIHGAFLQMVPLTDVYTRVGTLIVATLFTTDTK